MNANEYAKTEAEKSLDEAYRKSEEAAQRRTRLLTFLYPELSGVKAVHRRSTLDDAQQRVHKQKPMLIMLAALMLSIVSFLSALALGWPQRNTLFLVVLGVVILSQIVRYAVTRKVLRAALSPKISSLTSADNRMHPRAPR